MSAKEKQRIVDAWDKHIGKNNRLRRLASFSSVREEAFRKKFKEGILGHTRLTQEEKRELFVYAGL